MRNPRALNVLLWTVQVLLALFFAAGSGAPKLLLPPEMLPMPIPLPAAFITFIGICEVLGALGLVLTAWRRVPPSLTIAAATCLVLLTACATVYQLMANQPGNAVFAIGMGLLAAFVAIGRWRLMPGPTQLLTPTLRPAS
jgi:uncharacterized membrane protein